MLIPILLSLGLALPAETDRLEERLPSGALILSEQMPKAEMMSIALVSKATDTPETLKTHGWRHLVEHIVAKGPFKDLDVRLERVGGFLYAQTGRDTMSLRLDFPVTEKALGLKLAQELVSPLRTSAKEIETETTIIREELGFTSELRMANIAAWAKVYGTHRLDPLGDPDVMAKAGVDDLEKLHKTLFCTKNLVVSVCGPEGAETSIELARQIAESAPKAPELSFAAEDPKLQPQPVLAEVGDAAAVAMPAEGLLEKETIGKFVAAMAFASQGGGEVYFTPSSKPGLLTVAFSSGSALTTAAQTPPDQGLFSLGVLRARRWMQNQLASPGSAALVRGNLLAVAPFYRPEGFLEEIPLVSYEQFRAAYLGFAGLGKTSFTSSAPLTIMGGSVTAELAGQQNLKPISITETPMPGQPVVVSMLLKLPPLEANDASSVSLIVHALRQGTKTFTERQMLAYGSQAGIAPRIDRVRGGILIQIAMPASGLRTAAMLAESFLREPLLDEDRIKEWIATPPSAKRNRYEWALDPLKPNFTKLKVSDVTELWKRITARSSIFISTAGDFPQLDGEKEFTRRLEDWNPPRGKTTYTSGSPGIATDLPGAVGSLGLTGARLKPTELSKATVAMALLGVGKSSALFRTWRGEMGRAYQAEAFVQAGADGFVPRLVVFQRSKPTMETVAELRASLETAIAKWTQEDILGAAQMIRHGMMGRFPLPAIWFHTEGPLGGPSQIASAWSVFMAAQGAETTLAELFSGCAQVPVAEVQAYARDFLQNAGVTLLEAGNSG